MVSDERSVVSNNWSSVMNTMVGNNRGMVGSVGNNRGMVGRLGMRLSFISHISNESILMVSVVGHNLNSAIGQLNSVFS